MIRTLRRRYFTPERIVWPLMMTFVSGNNTKRPIRRAILRIFVLRIGVNGSCIGMTCRRRKSGNRNPLSMRPRCIREISSQQRLRFPYGKPPMPSTPVPNSQKQKPPSNSLKISNGSPNPPSLSFDTPLPTWDTPSWTITFPCSI